MATMPSLPGLPAPQGLSAGERAHYVLEGKSPMHLVPNLWKL